MIEISWVQVSAGAAGEFSSSGSTFCADSYFSIRSTPVLLQYHVKDPGHSAEVQWQVTAKHACILCMWLCMKWHGAWLYDVHRTHRDSSSFMWHQPRQCCKYTTLMDIEKHAKGSYSCRITCERSESAQERRKALYNSYQQQPKNNIFKKNPAGFKCKRCWR